MPQGEQGEALREPRGTGGEVGQGCLPKEWHVRGVERRFAICRWTWLATVVQAGVAEGGEKGMARGPGRNPWGLYEEPTEGFVCKRKKRGMEGRGYGAMASNEAHKVNSTRSRRPSGPSPDLRLLCSSKAEGPCFPEHTAGPPGYTGASLDLKAQQGISGHTFLRCLHYSEI